MDFPGFSLPADLLENFDTDILEFYYRILQEELDLSRKANAIGIKSELKTSLRNILNVRLNKVQYDSAFKRCAYIFKYAPCFASVVAHNFYELLRVNPVILFNAMKRRQLNICCLGGGPATEVVALSKIISAMQDYFWMRSGQALEFSVTIVDEDINWEIMTKNILRILEETPHLFDSEKISLSFRFVRADLTEVLDEKVREILQSADIVTMVYLISDMHRKVARRIYINRVKEILEYCKVGALLFYLDHFTSFLYERMNAALQTYGDLNQVYGPHLHQVQLMTLDSIKKCYELYMKDFYSVTCLYHLFYSVGAWVKTEKKLKDVKQLWSEAIKNVKKTGKKHTLCNKVKPGMFSIDKKTLEKNNMKVHIFHQKVNKLWSLESGLDEYLTSSGVKKEAKVLEQDVVDYVIDDIFFPTRNKRKRLFSNPKPI